MMSSGRGTTSGLGGISMVEDIGTEINGVGGINYLTLRTSSHSIVVCMTSIDNSCSTFVDLILENIVTTTYTHSDKANDKRDSGSD